MGDVVNVAARMEQTAQPGSVQIAEDTYRLVLPWVEVEALGEIEVKGKVETVAAYRVLRRKEHPGRARGIAGLTSPLVGWDRQLVQLCQAHTDLHNGRGQIVTLIGEAGLGKSRLVEELHGCVGQMKDERMFWIESRGGRSAAGTSSARRSRGGGPRSPMRHCLRKPGVDTASAPSTTGPGCGPATPRRRSAI